jgi:hypothetical protein
VSDIPYNVKFGSDNGKEESLEAYIDEMSAKSLGEHPWYVFKGNPVPESSDHPKSLVNLATIVIPKLMADVFSGLTSKQAPLRDSAQLSEAEAARRPFVNMQWALGTAGSGAPVHFHNTAWNQLFYGRKHWHLLPPGRNLMGKKQVLEWLEEDWGRLAVEGFEPIGCVQQQGDVIIVPESWGHAVLNILDSVAVASEVMGPIYRTPVVRSLQALSRASGQGSAKEGSRKGGGKGDGAGGEEPRGAVSPLRKQALSDDGESPSPPGALPRSSRLVKDDQGRAQAKSDGADPFEEYKRASTRNREPGPRLALVGGDDGGSQAPPDSLPLDRRLVGKGKGRNEQAEGSGLEEPAGHLVSKDDDIARTIRSGAPAEPRAHSFAKQPGLQAPNHRLGAQHRRGPGDGPARSEDDDVQPRSAQDRREHFEYELGLH